MLLCAPVLPIFTGSRGAHVQNVLGKASVEQEARYKARAFVWRDMSGLLTGNACHAGRTLINQKTCATLFDYKRRTLCRGLLIGTRQVAILTAFAGPGLALAALGSVTKVL